MVFLSCSRVFLVFSWGFLCCFGSPMVSQWLGFYLPSVLKRVFFGHRRVLSKPVVSISRGFDVLFVCFVFRRCMGFSWFVRCCPVLWLGWLESKSLNLQSLFSSLPMVCIRRHLSVLVLCFGIVLSGSYLFSGCWLKAAVDGVELCVVQSTNDVAEFVFHSGCSPLIRTQKN